MHAVEVAFESIHMLGPEPAERSQPVIHLLQWFRFQPVKTALRVYRGFYEAGISQHAQMLGYRRLREIERRFEIADGALATGKESQDGTAPRIGEDSECGFH